MNTLLRWDPFKTRWNPSKERDELEGRLATLFGLGKQRAMVGARNP